MTPSSQRQLTRSDPTPPRGSVLLAVVAAIALVVAACSDSTPETEGAGGSEASVEASSTTATFRTAPTVDETVPDAFVDLSLEEKIEQFLETPSSPLASNIAADMALDGDVRWGPWLLDLLRLGPSNVTDQQVAGALAILSGIERPADNFITDDYRTYGQWVYDEAIDPGPGYREWKLGLYNPIDDDYERLLAAVDDDLVLSRIQWGGVPRGGIPELNDPERVPGTEADWMVPDEIVFGVVIEDVSVAYPFRILGHHELANDTIGDTPVSLVFCTLCRTALLFDRRVDGQVLDFQTSGLLTNSNKIMVDTQTDTLWSHLEATGLAGPLSGVELGQFPLETTTWGEWLDANPDTEVLAIPDPIYSDNPEQGALVYDYEPGSAYRSYYDDPEVWFPILDTPTVDIGLKDEVLGLEFDDSQLAVSVADIVAGGARVFVVGDHPVLVVPNGSAGARVYDGVATSLADGDRPGFDADTERAVLDDGTELPRLAVNQGLWFAWFGNNPSTDWWPRSG